MDIFLLYIWTRLDAFSFILGLGLLLTSLAALACLFFIDLHRHGSEDELRLAANAKRRAKQLVFLAVVFGLLCAALPTKKDVALIVAGTATYRAITSERGSKIASAFADYIEREAISILEKKK